MQANKGLRVPARLLHRLRFS